MAVSFSDQEATVIDYGKASVRSCFLTGISFFSLS